LRIISGELRGKKLFTPPGLAIRPTSDRLRESIFNVLGDSVGGATVIDLFSGTGALGIEALSRGALHSTFIDFSKTAFDLLLKNLNACGLNSRARIIRWNIRNSLDCIRSASPKYNIVFMDPPYRKNLVVPTLKKLHDSGSLVDNATVVVEHAKEEPISKQGSFYCLYDQRVYGKILVSFLNYVL
jgi:16S rRNA (guanine966-N2)-methyltransferase